MAYEKPPAALLAVFPATRIAQVRSILADRHVPPERIHIDGHADEELSLLAEQAEEAAGGSLHLGAGHVGPAPTKEPSKALLVTLPLAAAVGALIAAPFALIPIGEASLSTRLIWFCIVGAAALATATFIVTSAMAVKDQLRPGAAQRGVVVRIDDPRPEIARALGRAHPIRLDRIDREGAVLDVVVTEEDHRRGGVLGEVADNFRREHEASTTEKHR